jgi:hypothetical protein
MQERKTQSQGVEIDFKVASRKRTHALGLLSLSFLGGATLYHRKVTDPVVGLMVSTTLLIFHLGVAAQDFIPGAKPLYHLHYPFALGFAAHVASFWRH